MTETIGRLALIIVLIIVVAFVVVGQIHMIDQCGFQKSMIAGKSLPILYMTGYCD